MSQLQERIAQFRKMTTEIPDDDLGHFRLAQLLSEAGEYEDSAKSFRRTLEISPQFSKAFQLLAAVHLKMDQRDEAVKVLNDGWKTADERGDKIPRDEMGKMLTELGEAIPQSEKTEEDDGPETGFRCKRPTCRSGKRAVPLAKPPIPDAIGLRIQREICEQCWVDWFKGDSIKVINELRLDLSTEHGQEDYDKYMRGFFGFDDDAPEIPLNPNA